MNCKLEKVSLNKYVLKDTNDKVLYNYTKNISLLGSNTLVFDENNLQLAEYKSVALSKTKYKIYLNGTEIDSVVLSEKTPLNKYQLSNKKWTIEGDITYTDYKVINEKSEIMLTVKCSMIDTNIWDVVINTDEKTLAATLILLIYSIAKK